MDRSQVRDIAILEHILLDWRIWDKAVEDVWKYLLWQLEQLLKPPDVATVEFASSKNCPSQESFNIKCFLKANAIVRILLTSKVSNLVLLVPSGKKWSLVSYNEPHLPVKKQAWE